MKAGKEWKAIAWLVGGFFACYFLPLEREAFRRGVWEGFELLRWYAREHVILCLVPAFFIAGAIAVFVRKEAVMRYLGPGAPKGLAYGVAAVSGSVLAVCSCTVLPLFAGIWRMGAGLGPAVAFLYSGPAISALSIILTARVLGVEIGVARAVGAVGFAVVIGWIMAQVFRREEKAKVLPQEAGEEEGGRPLWKTAAWLGAMVFLLVFANWSEGAGDGFFGFFARWKWVLSGVCAASLGVALVVWFGASVWKVGVVAAVVGAVAWGAPDFGHGWAQVIFALGAGGLVWIIAGEEGELGDWWNETWEFTKLIAPMLFAGVFVSGFLLGRPGQEGVVPASWVASVVGGNSLLAISVSAVAGAFMYFATLTEIPIVQGLLAGGMGKGPALALLLAGPALSLPSMLALGKIFGAKKTVVYCSLVVVMATLCGWIYGVVFA